MAASLTAEATASQTKDSAVVFDPFSPEIIADPYPHYDRIRAVDPIHQSQFGFWFLTRYDDVSSLLRDRRFGKSVPRAGESQVSNEPAIAALSRTLLYLNPPDHTRVRGLVSHGFATKQIEAMRPVVQQFADELIDQVAAIGRMDIVRDYALPLSLNTISELLGIPRDKRAAFFDGLPPFLGRTLEAPALSRRDLDEANARTRYFQQFFLPLIELRRQRPGNDIITDMVRARFEDGKLTDLELVSNVTLLFSAGFETTASLVGNAVLALHRHPNELARVRQDASAIQSGMDEFLRYCASIQFAGRMALEDVEFGGKQISRGDNVIVSVAAANRDPAIFDDPHRLDLTRKNVRPLSFGSGIHFCLGAQLARMETEIALSTLLKRLPALKLEDIERPRWKPSFIFRGLESLAAFW